MTKMNRVGLNNRQMNDDVYAMRRVVMGIIYECLKIKRDLPRVEVRITTKQGRVLGKATVNSSAPHVSVMDYVIKSQDENLITHVVLHELCHTWFNLQHDEKCHLMRSVLDKPLTKTEAFDTFKKYAHGA